MKRTTVVALAAAVLAAAALLILLWDQPTPQARAASTDGTNPTPGDEGDCTLADATDGIELPGEVDRVRGVVCRTVDGLDDLELTAERLDGASLEPVAGS